MDTFLGFPRQDGRAGTRNYLAVIPTVFCANEVAAAIAKKFKTAVPLLHHQGCGQLKPDLQRVSETLISLGTNPNVGAVLLVGLGCEGVSIDELHKALKDRGQKVEKIVIQDAGGKKATQKGLGIAARLERHVLSAKRKPVPADRLVMGIKCGSSDGSSGLVSNPAVGLTSDFLVGQGGTVIFGETTEFLGAEHLLARRAVNGNVASRIFEIVTRMEDRVKAAGTDMRGGNPSPGNIRGGLTTIEEKSLGAICKSGSMPISGVMEYGQPVPGKGLFIIDSPGKEAEIMTGLSAAGANVIVFSTGGGAPQGFPLVPVVKVAGNPAKCRVMQDHIDVDAGGVLQGKCTIEDISRSIYSTLLKVGGGAAVKAEKLKYDQTVEIYTTGPTI